MPIKVKSFHAESAGKPATPRVGLQRLERLAGFLEDAHRYYKKIGTPSISEDAEQFDEDGNLKVIEGYCQQDISHMCGTPACAIGHYAFNTPQRWGWTKSGQALIAQDFEKKYFKSAAFGDSADWPDQAEHEFCITTSEMNELFDYDGCGNAKTALEAAKYIRKFVARKRKELGLKKPVKK